MNSKIGILVTIAGGLALAIQTHAVAEDALSKQVKKICNEARSSAYGHHAKLGNFSSCKLDADKKQQYERQIFNKYEERKAKLVECRKRSSWIKCGGFSTHKSVIKLCKAYKAACENGS